MATNHEVGGSSPPGQETFKDHENCGTTLGLPKQRIQRKSVSSARGLPGQSASPILDVCGILIAESSRKLF